MVWQMKEFCGSKDLGLFGAFDPWEGKGKIIKFIYQDKN